MTLHRAEVTFSSCKGRQRGLNFVPSHLLDPNFDARVAETQTRFYCFCAFFFRRPPRNPLIGFSSGEGGDKRGSDLHASASFGFQFASGIVPATGWELDFSALLSLLRRSILTLFWVFQESAKLSVNFTNCFPVTHVVNHQFSHY